MTPAQRRRWEAERAAFNALPEEPVNPDRLQGPEEGTRVHHTSRYPEYDADATVTERSYVWAPDKPCGHGTHRGYRRYDLKVVRFDNGKTLLVNDKDLVTL